jgi:hypothetical protein
MPVVHTDLLSSSYGVALLQITRSLVLVAESWT